MLFLQVYTPWDPVFLLFWGVSSTLWLLQVMFVFSVVAAVWSSALQYFVFSQLFEQYVVHMLLLRSSSGDTGRETVILWLHDTLPFTTVGVLSHFLFSYFVKGKTSAVLQLVFTK